MLYILYIQYRDSQRSHPLYGHLMLALSAISQFNDRVGGGGFFMGGVGSNVCIVFVRKALF